MGKCGPCCHCGVTSTPLWRNGPSDKPVLCNACGSRWRTKGSLANYTPLHSREAFDAEEPKVSKLKIIPSKPKEQKLRNKKQINGSFENDNELRYCDQNFQKVIKGDTSNRSSAGSAVSYSESCAYFGTESDITASAQSNAWDPLVPSRKRTFLNRSKPSSVEKLAKDLCSIWHEQQSSNISGYSEDDLLYQSGTPLDSFEIGYGSLLIKNPNSKSIEEESEASSFPVDKSLYTTGEAYSGSSLFPVNREKKGMSLTNSGVDKLKKSAAAVNQVNTKRDSETHEMLRMLQHSLLNSSYLNDVINFEGFLKYLTHEEQQQLMKYLPSIDTAKPPESLKSMFKSPQLFETITCFQQLLQDGIFDLSLSRANLEDYRMLKRHVLHNLKKPEWVELYSKIKDKTSRQMMPGNELSTKPNFPEFTKLPPPRRAHKSQYMDSSELKDTMRSTKRVCRAGPSATPGRFAAELITDDAGSKLTDETHEFEDKGASFSPSSLFASSPDRSSLLAPLQYTADSSDHDILLDVPHGAAYAEAELLCSPWKERTISNASPEESGIIDGEESLSSFPTFCSTKVQVKRR